MVSIKLLPISENLLKSFEEKIRKYSKVAILTHSNADPDAVASSIAFYFLVQKIYDKIQTRIFIPENISLEARKLIEILKDVQNIVVIIRKDVSEAMNFIDRDTLCIIADVASYDQLKNLKHVIDRCGDRVVVDHHVNRVEDEHALQLVFPVASSTSEIVFAIAAYLGVELPKEVMECLIAGIVYDTKRFSRATEHTFASLALMLAKGASYEHALSLTRIPQPRHQRIAKIKCVLRHRGFKVSRGDREIFIAISEIGAYESDCANALIGLGYDVAFVLTEDEILKAVRIVFRARDDVVLQGFDPFNDILSELIKTMGGGGGGHRVAGAAIVRCYDVEHVGQLLIKVLIEKYGSSLVELVEKRVAQ